MRDGRSRGQPTRLTADVERAITLRMQSGVAGGARARSVASGPGWSVDDVICNLGPHDRPFEEHHAGVSIGMVAAGTFQYRTGRGRQVLVPGSMLLGNDGQCFECSHDHAPGDRCIAFRFAPEYFERIAADVGARRAAFDASRLPPLRDAATLWAAVFAGLTTEDAPWEEIALHAAARVLRLANTLDAGGSTPRSAERRVTETVRAIERDPARSWPLTELAELARLSPYHYLRTFQQVTGVTPHQFILRTRLREAATQLWRDGVRITDVAFATGFGDLSNFNHAFRSEFGSSPRRFRPEGLFRYKP